MCTVTYVRSGTRTIITSNRDEHVVRSSSGPQQTSINNKSILFPKDPKSGGTWFAADQMGNVIVLLNGGAEKHKHLPPYRKSRGLIVLDIVSGNSPVDVWTTIDLNDIEPFTIVLLQKSKLYQLQWDGTIKHATQLNEKENYIWSSSTLYPAIIRKERQQWFQNFLNAKPDVSDRDMLHFHRYTEGGNNENGLVINRNEVLKTLSITQTVIDENHLTMIHLDLLNNRESTTSFDIGKTVMP